MAFDDTLFGGALQSLPAVGQLFGPNRSPQLTPTALPANSRGLLDTQEAQGTMTPEQIQARNMQGQEQGQRFLRSPEQTSRMSQSLGMDPNAPMNDAISQRANRSYARNQSLINTTQNIQAPAELAKQQQLAMASQFGNQQFENQQYADQLQKYFSNMQARTQVIQSLFRLGGVIGGQASVSGGKKPSGTSENDNGNNDGFDSRPSGETMDNHGSRMQTGPSRMEASNDYY